VIFPAVNPILLIMGVSLALSLAGNAVLGKVYLDARDERVEATGARDQARAAASSCSDATEALRELADKQAAEGKAAAAVARRKANSHEQLAQQILATPASTPGDDCKSAHDRARTWLQGRAKP
jgi:hypothetical protein